MCLDIGGTTAIAARQTGRQDGDHHVERAARRRCGALTFRNQHAEVLRPEHRRVQLTVLSLAIEGIRLEKGRVGFDRGLIVSLSRLRLGQSQLRRSLLLLVVMIHEPGDSAGERHAQAHDRCDTADPAHQESPGTVGPFLRGCSLIRHCLRSLSRPSLPTIPANHWPQFYGPGASAG